MQSQNDSICAIATPSGAGALGIIRVSGADTLSIVSKICSKNIEKSEGYKLYFAKILKNEKVLDEVLLSVFRAPKSFTGEDVVEISCHGSRYILQEIMQLLLENKCRLAEPGEFSMRAFLNGKMDLTQTEAIADLIASESEKEHQIAMHQMRGGFSKEINHLREELIHFASLIELELDFGEEDVEFADRADLKALLSKILKYIDNLIQSFQLGNAIKNGIPVAIVGKPNAGKSTLLNALLNEERALVTDIPGTTRDTIEDEINIEGIKFRFIDTAGIRETTDLIEAMGVERSLEKLRNSALVIYLFDVNSTSNDDLLKEEKVLQSEIKNGKYLLVGNKVDLQTENDLAANFKAENVLYISAKNHDIQHLKSTLVALVADNALSSGDTIITNARHLAALKDAHESLSRAMNSLNTNITGDFIAMDIRQSLHHLGLITGSISVEDLLGNIFSRFCIGK